jgi:hypothetical protein
MQCLRRLLPAHSSSTAVLPAAKSLNAVTFNMFRQEDFFFVGVVVFGSPNDENVGLPIVFNETVWR